MTTEKLKQKFYQTLIDKNIKNAGAKPRLPSNKARNYESLIDIQGSSISFEETFSKIMDASFTDKYNNILKASWLDTSLGLMIAVADEKYLYLLEFVDWHGLVRTIHQLQINTKSSIIPGDCAPIRSIKSELKAYFKGKLHKFKTPICPIGSPFQKLAWKALIDIPYGKTISYLDQATVIGKESAYRAVANANGVNQLAIVIPCHRVINNNGNLGGYGGGIARKKWLLQHEKQNKL